MTQLHGADAPMRIYLGDTSLPVRAGVGSDRSFVFSTWQRSLQWPVPRDVAMAANGSLVESALQHVYCVGDETIHAWIAGRSGLLWYAYVRPELRRNGLCRKLAEMICGQQVMLLARWPGPLPNGWHYVA